MEGTEHWHREELGQIGHKEVSEVREKDEDGGA